MQRQDSTVDLLGIDFRINASQQNISDTRIDECESLITQAYSFLLKEKDSWAQFNGLRVLLSNVKEWQSQGNFNGYSALENWLRYQLVSLFRKILACEVLFRESNEGTVIHLANFKMEFEKIASDDDFDGVRKDICDDFIYRCSLHTLEAEAKRTGKKITELLIDPEFPDATLKRNVTIPLMVHNNGGMPYFARATTQNTMIDPAPKKLHQTAESYADQENRVRDLATASVKNILNDRINKFGILDPLPPVGFAAFYESRHPLSKVVTSTVEPVQEKHFTLWKKIFMVVTLGLIGAAVGALVAYFSAAPIAAVVLAGAIGFSAGLLCLGGLVWAASKLFKACCHASAKQVIDDEQVEPAEPSLVSPRHNLDPRRFSAPENKEPPQDTSVKNEVLQDSSSEPAKNIGAQSIILQVTYTPFDDTTPCCLKHGISPR